MRVLFSKYLWCFPQTVLRENGHHHFKYEDNHIRAHILYPPPKKKTYVDLILIAEKAMLKVRNELGVEESQICTQEAVFWLPPLSLHKGFPVYNNQLRSYLDNQI